MNILEFFNSTFSDLNESSEAVEIFLRNASFSTLFISMMFYWIQTAFSSMRKTALPLLKVVNGEQRTDPIIIGKKMLNFDLFKSSSDDSFQRKFSSSGESKLTNFGTITMILSNFLLMGLLIVRWKESGHFPLSNLYESLMFLSWSCTCIHLILNQIVKTAIVRLDATLLTKLIGSITSPSALFTNAFATFSLPAEMQKASPLVPALQSNWLMMHVTVMIISYSALILGSLLSIAFLILISAKPSSSELKKPGFFKSQSVASTVVAKQGQQELHKLKFPVLASCYLRSKKPGVSLEGRAISSGTEYGLQGMAVTTSQSLSQSMSSRENGLSQNELLLSLTPKGLEATLPILPKSKGFDELQDLWKQPLFENQKQETLIFQKTKNDLAWNFDNLSYRVLGIGFPFLTIGILSGAVWANEAWGSYWSWDPKETWALLTWLIFAIYLHARITKGWQGKKPAIIASFGFVAIWVCFLGVNLIGEGLHSYGWFSIS